jgi:hypothetical protein
VEERRTRDVLASAGHMLQRSHATVGWAATELLERQRRLAAAESEAATRAHGFGAKADMANLGLVAAQVRGGSRGNTNMGTKVASVGHLSPDGFVHHSIAIRGAGRTTARAAGQSAAAGALGRQPSLYYDGGTCSTCVVRSSAAAAATVFAAAATVHGCGGGSGPRAGASRTDTVTTIP